MQSLREATLAYEIANARRKELHTRYLEARDAVPFSRPAIARLLALKGDWRQAEAACTSARIRMLDLRDDREARIDAALDRFEEVATGIGYCLKAGWDTSDLWPRIAEARRKVKEAANG